jgi:hypothetical protein
VAVTGVEVTQAIQDPGNAIPLVNGKTTVVRVYVKSTIGVAYPNVHGQLMVSGSGVGAHNPVNASSITASPTGSDRRSLADSFAFLLDATETGSGSRSISVQLFDGDPARNMRLGNTTLTVQFSAPDLRFHTYGVTYGYTDVDPATQAQVGLTGPDWPARPGPGEPGDAFEPQREWAENVYPVRQLQVYPAPGNPHPTFDYQGGMGYIAARMWGQRLIDMLWPLGGERIYVLQPERNDYHGYHYVDSIGNHVMNGQEGGDPGPTFAHELGHSWGLPHPFDPGSSYPETDGWLGDDVGVRIVGPLTVIPGDTATGAKVTFDMMSYTAPFWISPFNYCLLMGTISVGAVRCPAGANALSQPW